MTDTTPTDVGSDRQLFLDDFWVGEAKDVERVLHQPRRASVAIAAEKPYELGHIGYMVAIEDGGRFRAWYRGNADRPGKTMDGPFAAYAESDDGVHWTKPNLGIYEYEGSKDNNLVWLGPGYNMGPFRDDNPDAREDERYKALARNGGLLALASPDGLHWRLMQDEPVMTEGPFDSHNIAFWDGWREEYVAYARGVGGVDTGSDGPAHGGGVRNFKGGVRWIRRATSKDFVNWSSLENIDTGDAPFEHFYTNSCVQYERAPGTYLMFPSRFVVDRVIDPDWYNGPGVSDVVMMSSRDGLNFDRSFLEGFVRPGLDKENWHERGVYMERGVLLNSPTEMSLYGMEHSKYPSVHIERYALRTDGFVSINAGYSGGEMITRPFTYTGGELELNYSTSAVGSVRVEVQDAEGRPLPGLALDDCPETFGDEIEGVVRWEGSPDLSALAGTPVRLRFALKDADVYAFRFR